MIHIKKFADMHSVSSKKKVAARTTQPGTKTTPTPTPKCITSPIITLYQKVFNRNLGTPRS
ncbi:hypothetical protein ADICYQ_2564 [Cyclobacterium qasimii M12-11B]|uniref:Uncharacterized protein n=1 Tax=Cyclobacterium qasimii M12-11B TaxID=641524 RepID=S7WP22_9BACT|nr:hypothetical protein ADICYQ_2564 [Cyclobacterium qasimii M12-11B]